MSFSIFPNSTPKTARDLRLFVARELAELTGENATRLYAWAQQHPEISNRCGVLETFSNAIRSDGWMPHTTRTVTRDCRLGSYPFACDLRFRAVSLTTQFRRDVQRQVRRQLILLWGYETCTQLLHFRVYRGEEFTGDSMLSLCDEIPALTLADFAHECARMVGLPIKRLLLTQPLLMTPIASENEAVYLSLENGSLEKLLNNITPPVNALPVVLVEKLQAVVGALAEPAGGESMVAWCQGTNATALTDLLSKWVRMHNSSNALERLQVARARYDLLYGESKKRWAMKNNGWNVAMPPLMQQRTKHGYLDARMSIHEVRFYKREYERFRFEPGVRLKQGGLHGDSGDIDTAT